MNTVIREAYERVEKYVHAKYAEAMQIADDSIKVPRRVDRLLFALEEDRISLKVLTRRAQSLPVEHARILGNQLLLYVADRTGDLIETYRYESIVDGEAYEQFLDTVLSVANKFLVQRGVAMGSNDELATDRP